MPQSAVMRSALALAQTIDRLTAALGRTAAWLALAIVLVQFGLVVARYVFSAGSVAVTESVVYGQALLVALTTAWTLAAGGHVRVDIFYAEAPPHRRALIDLVGTLCLLLPFMLTLLWLSVPYALRSWAIMERSQETGGLPLVFVLKTLIPVFALLMALQGIAQAIRAAASVLIPPALAGEGGERSEPGGGSANFDVTPPPAVTRRTLPLQGRD
jgi:TRAP-type mannitol/chloroaromatic compound transport system permease small subunit